MPSYTLDQFLNELADALEKEFAPAPTDGEAPKPPEEAPEAATDPAAEAFRLLKKAEAAAVGRENEAELLIQIADRNIRVIEAALIYQS